MNPANAPSLHGGTLPGFGGFVPNADVQVFVPVLLSQTCAPGTAGQNFYGMWTKPKGCTLVRVLMQGPGGGGGSGRKGTTITQCCGGGGGASGNVIDLTFLASDLPDEIPVYVPAGGAGGAAVTASDTSGNSVSFGGQGAYGPNTCFGAPILSGSNLVILGARSGFGGSGGTAASGAGGATAGYGYNLAIGVTGGAANTSGTAGAAGASNALGPASGGAGGGLTSGNAHSAGGAGGQCISYQTGAGGEAFGAAGTAGGGNGGNGGNGLTAFLLYSSTANPGQLPSGLLMPGSGGGGGGSANSGDAVQAATGAMGSGVPAGVGAGRPPTRPLRNLEPVAMVGTVT